LSFLHFPARVRWAAAVGASVAAALLAVAGPATAAEPTAAVAPTPNSDPVPAGFASWQQLYTVQQRIDAVAEQIRDAATGPDATGFGSIVVEPERNQLRLYWKGAVPAPVRAVLAKDTGVTVRVERAVYSEADLLAEVDSVMAAQPVGGKPAANQVTGAGPLPDSSGLRVFVNGSAAEGRALPAVLASSVPVTVEGGVLPRTIGRADDSSPYFGGAMWSANLFCSTGFAVKLGSTTKVLSAGHCGSNGSFAFDGGGDPMGVVTRSNVAGLDALLIDARASGHVFTGFGVSERVNRVIGQLGNNFGDRVCTSGAYSGTRCNIMITGPNTTQSFLMPDGTVVTYSRLVFAQQQGGLNAGGTGDSGGPVFSFGSDEISVQARGTLTGADTPNSPVTCTGVLGRACSSSVWYTTIALALNGFGAQLVTS
jgi:hypothetical protein